MPDSELQSTLDRDCPPACRVAPHPHRALARHSHDTRSKTTLSRQVTFFPNEQDYRIFPQEFTVPLFTVEISSYLGAALVFLTFYMKTMLPLRYIAIGSNRLFSVYAALAQLNPVLILHCILLPLNIYRISQLKRLIANVTAATTGGFSINWLLPYMNRRHMRAGDYVFHQGEIANDMFYMVRGEITLPEVEVQRSAGNMLGEIGLFPP